MQNFGQILLGVPDLDALNLRAELMAPFSLQLCACAVQQEIKPTYLHPGQGQKHPISDPLQPRAQVQHPGSPRAVLLGWQLGSSGTNPTRYFSPCSRSPARPCTPSSSGDLLTRPLGSAALAFMRDEICLCQHSTRHRGLPTNRRLQRCYLVFWLIA